MNRVYLAPIWRILDGMDSGNRWRLGHRPALDGLRGVAVVLVIAYHAIGDRFPAGGIVGVTAFFVLSGFLITSLLLEERSTRGEVSLRGFYLRRARRLFPALAVMLAAMVPIALLGGNVRLGSVLAATFYSADWWLLTGHHLGMFIHTWTLSAEEQFYLLWPVVLLAMKRARISPLVLVGVAVVPLAFLTQLSIVVSADALLAGCGLALWMHGRAVPPRVPAAAIVAALVVMVAACWIHATPIISTVVSTGASLMLVYGIATDSPAPVLSTSLARWLGRRSYGLYLWHLPVLTVAVLAGVGAGLTFGQSVVVGLVPLVGIVELSWRFVEQPFLRRSTPRRRSQAAAAWAAARVADSAVP